MISVLNPFRKLDMPFALCSLPPCIHSHVTAKYSVNIFQIPTKYIATIPDRKVEGRRLRLQKFTLLDGIFTLF